MHNRLRPHPEIPAMKFLRFTPLALAALMAGCSLMPAYQQPVAPVPGRFAGDAGADPAPATPIAELGWRDVFTDPSLQRVIEMSLANNRDLRVAVLNIEKARAQYRVQDAALFPIVNASAGGSGSRTPADLSSTGEALTARQYSASPCTRSSDIWMPLPASRAASIALVQLP